MEDEKVIPTVQELAGFDLNDPAVIELIHQAQESDAADRELTIKQALKKYKKAVFWAMLLSTSLIMEGYDLVIVRSLFWTPKDPKYLFPTDFQRRSLLSMANNNFKLDLEHGTKLKGIISSRRHGSQAFRTQPSSASWQA
jgi:hypothetical protein